MFIEFRQHYCSILGASTNYVDVLPRELTLDRNFVARRFRTNKTNTVFDEAHIVPVSWLIVPEVRRTFATTASVQETAEHLFKRIEDRLIEIVAENWSPDKTHVILSSSGYDSRMLMWSIRRNLDERGAAWFGDTVFLCSKLEGESFREIVKYLDFDQYAYVIGDEIDGCDYYMDSLIDFAGAWQRLGGVANIPVNLFWYLPETAERQGLFSPPIQLWTGQWGNAVFDYCSHELSGARYKSAYVELYYSIMCQRPLRGEERVLPYTDCELARITAESNVKMGKELRFSLLKSMDEKLVAFENMRSDGDRHRRISEWLLRKMQLDYYNSWYGKNVAPQARLEHHTTEFQEFWSRWTAASLCEHLLEEGYEIALS